MARKAEEELIAALWARNDNAARRRSGPAQQVRVIVRHALAVLPWEVVNVVTCDRVILV